jgi:hypothetical protein
VTKPPSGLCNAHKSLRAIDSRDSEFFFKKKIKIANTVNLPLFLNQSHLPSFHPVLQRSSQNRQSNSAFPNLRLTELCASHIHVPKSARPERRGVFRPPGSFIQARKSSAHTQHGYKREKSFRNDRISDCCSGAADTGYAAVKE